MPGGLLVHRRGAVAVVTLTNATKRNALDPSMLQALCAELERFPAEGVRAVVLTGAGTYFSSGYDLSALPEGISPAENPLGPALEAIAGGPLPVVAALNGPAIGGGCELAATCDLRVAHPAVTLTMPPVRLGLVYAAEGIERFVGLIGTAHTRELFLTASPTPAERALSWGLVDRVVEEGAVLETAVALAGEMAEGAPLAVAGTRRTLELLRPRLSPEAARELASLVTRAWESEDAREARAAFREKRRPRFTGR